MISVIIPAHNCESSIEKCLDSLINQDYKEFEIIVVENASEDSTYKLCMDYANKFEKIKVIHCDEKGVSHARNVGLKASNGEYIVFVDSDDWVEENYLHLLYKGIESKQQSQLVVCGYINEFEDGKSDKTLANSEDVGTWILNENPEIYLRLHMKYLMNVVWNKIYCKKYIQTGFEEWIQSGEDLAFNIEYLSNIESINVVDETPYHYSHKHMEKTTNKMPKNKFRQLSHVYKNTADYYKKLGGKNVQEIYHTFFDVCFGAYWCMMGATNIKTKEKMSIVNAFVNDKFVRESIKHYSNQKDMGMFCVFIKYRLTWLMYLQIIINEHCLKRQNLKDEI